MLNLKQKYKRIAVVIKAILVSLTSLASIRFSFSSSTSKQRRVDSEDAASKEFDLDRRMVSFSGSSAVSSNELMVVSPILVTSRILTSSCCHTCNVAALILMCQTNTAQGQSYSVTGADIFTTNLAEADVKNVGKLSSDNVSAIQIISTLQKQLSLAQ